MEVRQSKNGSQTSAFGDTTNHSPKTEVRRIKRVFLTSVIGGRSQDAPKTEDTDPRTWSPTSVIGDTRTTRRRRKLDSPKRKT